MALVMIGSKKRIGCTYPPNPPVGQLFFPIGVMFTTLRVCSCEGKRMIGEQQGEVACCVFVGALEAQKWRLHFWSHAGDGKIIVICTTLPDCDQAVEQTRETLR